MCRNRVTGLLAVALMALLLSACAGPAAPQAPEAPLKEIREVAGFKIPEGILDIPGIPLYVPQDEKEKDVKSYKRGGTFNYRSLDPPHLDIGLTSSCTVYNENDMVYNKLVRADIGPLADPVRVVLKGDLAKSWEISPDAKVFTFKLQEGVKWQNLPPVNGREFTSADVKWSFEDYKTSIQADTFEGVDKIETPDKYTVKVTLKEPNVDFVAGVASMSFIRPREIKDEDGSFRKRAVGTGPFILDKWTPKQGENYSRNPTYWEKDSAGNPLPYLDKANKFVIDDVAAARAAYRSKQVDELSFWGALKAEADAVLASDPDTVFSSAAPGLFRGNVNGILLRVDKPPLNDVRVRRAISMGIDRQRITDNLYGGFWAMSMGQPWSSAMDRNPSLKEYGPYYQYNPEGAKKLLAEAGFPNGLTLEMKDWYLRTPAEALIGMLAEVNVTIKRQQVDNPTQVELLTKGTYGDMTAAAWYIPGYDIDSQLYPFLHSTGKKNYGKYSNPEMDKLLVAQRLEQDPEKRKVILKKIWDLQLEDPSTIWFPSSLTVYGWRSYVKNYRSHGIMGNLACYTTGNNNRIIWIDK